MVIRDGKETSMELLGKEQSVIKGRLEDISGKIDNLSTAVVRSQRDMDGKINSLFAAVIQMQNDLQVLLHQTPQETGVQPQGSLSTQRESAMEAVKKSGERNVFGCAGVSNEIEEERLEIPYDLRQESDVEEFRRNMGWSSGSSPRVGQVRDTQIPNFSSPSSTPLLLTEKSPPPPTLKLTLALHSTSHQHPFYLKKSEWSFSRVDSSREVTIPNLLVEKKPSGSPSDSSRIDQITEIPNPSLRTSSPATISYASTAAFNRFRRSLEERMLKCKSPRLLTGFRDVNKGRRQREISRKKKRKRKRFKQRKKKKREEEDQHKWHIRVEDLV